MGNTYARPEEPTACRAPDRDVFGVAGLLLLHSERAAASPECPFDFPQTTGLSHERLPVDKVFKINQNWTCMDLKSFEITLKKTPKTPQPDLQHMQGLQGRSLLLSPHEPIPQFQAAQCRGASLSSRAERRISPAFTSPDGQYGEPRNSSVSTQPLAPHGHTALCQHRQPLSLCILDSKKSCHSFFPFLLLEYWSSSPNHHHSAALFPPLKPPPLLETAFKARFGTNNVMCLLPCCLSTVLSQPLEPSSPHLWAATAI